MLIPRAAQMLQQAPLLALGTLDSQDRPWTTIWGGESGFSRPLGNSIIGIRTLVDRKYDPVVETLFRGNVDGEVVREEGKGRMVGGLTIDLESRKRVKLYGRMVAGAVSTVGDEKEGGDRGQGEVQLVVQIEQSLGNCPKYLNKKTIHPAAALPALLSDSPHLPPAALALLAKADLFFISSSNSSHDMDTNHRGGPPGFVRVLSNTAAGAVLIYPEYSGNRLYQTLGNLQITPRAGCVFPDFDTGDVLYVSGRTEILVGTEAAKLLPRSNLAVKITVDAGRYVARGLPLRGTPGDFSPYNPHVRLLAHERHTNVPTSDVASNTATLVAYTPLTPTISRLRFALTDPVTYAAGQWVALDVSAELDTGYSHMRDEDPRAINDDWLRTFSVSSTPAPRADMESAEFEITIRRVGPVTEWLFREGARLEAKGRVGGAGLEVAVSGIGGDFRVRVPDADGGEDGEVAVPFVAGGVGITPLLSQLPSLPLHRLRLFWTLHVSDIAFALDVLSRHSGLAPSTTLFLTGAQAGLDASQEAALEKMCTAGTACHRRRIVRGDLVGEGREGRALANTWYVCAGTRLRRELIEWLEGKEVVYEDFDF
ncbi:hypothetical protein B0A49_01090 [Cryomyces minteri]|uniref:FAD-binding FR-type domain-containing protein n=1 Tax=Cryomyces minteri TaxID=331657 RepID=A0A4U0XPZ8_9PEZI|nr:hypothetical protein B0A49_01090 [Cryomyces minteri]